jgi:hypothetical protein
VARSRFCALEPGQGREAARPRRERQRAPARPSHARRADARRPADRRDHLGERARAPRGRRALPVRRPCLAAPRAARPTHQAWDAPAPRGRSVTRPDPSGSAPSAPSPAGAIPNGPASIRQSCAPPASGPSKDGRRWPVRARRASARRTWVRDRRVRRRTARRPRSGAAPRRAPGAGSCGREAVVVAGPGRVWAPACRQARTLPTVRHSPSASLWITRVPVDNPGPDRRPRPR